MCQIKDIGITDSRHISYRKRISNHISSFFCREITFKILIVSNFSVASEEQILTIGNVKI